MVCLGVSIAVCVSLHVLLPEGAGGWNVKVEHIIVEVTGIGIGAALNLHFLREQRFFLIHQP